MCVSYLVISVFAKDAEKEVFGFPLTSEPVNNKVLC